MEINLKKMIGLLLAGSAIAEFAFTYHDYKNGMYVKYPWVAEIGFFMMLIIGLLLIFIKKKES